MARSIFARKRDLLYTVFFTIHIPLIFGELTSKAEQLVISMATNRPNCDGNMLTKNHFIAVDLYPLYPRHVVPLWMTELRQWYIKTFQDQFFMNPP